MARNTRITVQRTSFCDLDCVFANDGQTHIGISTEVGPRILSFGPLGSLGNICYLQPGIADLDPESWHGYGGGRLWTSGFEEAHPNGPHAERTYAIDNNPVGYSRHGNRLVFAAVPEREGVGVQKTITVSFQPNGSVKVDYAIKNTGFWPKEIGCWAITAVRPNGTVIIPLPQRKEHLDDLVPNRVTVGWPCYNGADGRVKEGDRYLTFNYKPGLVSNKFGMFPAPWIAYQQASLLFVKSVEVFPGAKYPDRGCNVETYMDGRRDAKFAEIETMSPLILLNPEEIVRHTEYWWMFEVDRPITGRPSQDQIDRMMTPFFDAQP